MTCKLKINELYSFKQKCKKSNELLLTLFGGNNKIKTKEEHQQQSESEPVIRQKGDDVKKATIVKEECTSEMEEYQQLLVEPNEQDEGEGEEEGNLNQDEIEENDLTDSVFPTSPEYLDYDVSSFISTSIDGTKVEGKSNEQSNNDDDDVDDDYSIEIETNPNEDDQVDVVEDENVDYTPDDDGDGDGDDDDGFIERLEKVDEAEKKLNDMIEYHCYTCGRVYKSITELTEHENMEHKMRKKRRKKNSIGRELCQFCNVVLREKEKTAEHMEFHKKTFNLILDSIDCYRCGICSTVYLTSDELEEHFKSNSCNRNLSNLVSLEVPENEYIENNTDFNYERKMTTIDKQESQFKCITCDYECKTFAWIIQHNTDVHLIDDKTTEDITSRVFNNGIHKCGVCSIYLPNPKETLLHIYLHSKIFHCPFYICGNEYDSFFKLNLHLEKNHLNFKNPTCSHCHATFDTNDELSIHLRNECNKRNLKCFYCEKKFLTSGSLKIHERIHTKEKRFMCQVCGKKFVQRGDLTTHNRIHNGEKPYKCHQCDKRFRTSGHRNDHMSTHNVDKKFECEVCFKSFKAMRILKSHMTLHTQEKHCPCPMCGKLFSRKQHVKSHMKVHFRKSKDLGLQCLEEEIEMSVVSGGGDDDENDEHEMIDIKQE